LRGADKQIWRLITYSEHDAATNMAIDEAVLETHAIGLTPPTVRLYCFAPAAVTIGFGQKMAATEIARIRREGFDIVRRPTGGRAVLHADDLTYSFVGNSAGAKNEGEATVHELGEFRWSPFLSPTINGAYKEICRGLIDALRALSVQAELGACDAAYRQLHDCFLATTTADLHVNGRKIIGSAQLRRNGYVLQHGSILLNQDQQLMHYLLTGEHSEQERHANLFEAASKRFTKEQLQESIKGGFETAFGCRLVVGELTERERLLAQELRQKYLLPASDAAPVTA
jgi:lipoate-protein ligase A